MSKIEDALNKVLMIRQSTSPAGELSVLEFGTAAAPRASSQDIACMVEPAVFEHRELARKRIIYPEMANSGVVNAFRQLRTKLLHQSGGRNGVCMVTSVRSGSGSSFIALNLAAAFAFDETKTALLIDCNLYDAGFDELLYSKSKRDLFDYLDQDGVGIEEIVQPSGIPRLRWIPAGAKRGITTEVFTSAKMRNLLQSLKERYDDRHIIIDAPPITKSADAEILIDFCDYVLLVVPYGKATESQILAAAMGIGEEKLLGVIFNNAP
jgi:protein-tyrosine kinase